MPGPPGRCGLDRGPAARRDRHREDGATSCASREASGQGSPRSRQTKPQAWEAPAQSCGRRDTWVPPGFRPRQQAATARAARDGETRTLAEDRQRERRRCPGRRDEAGTHRPGHVSRPLEPSGTFSDTGTTRLPQPPGVTGVHPSPPCSGPVRANTESSRHLGSTARPSCSLLLSSPGLPCAVQRPWCPLPPRPLAPHSRCWVLAREAARTVRLHRPQEHRDWEPGDVPRADPPHGGPGAGSSWVNGTPTSSL